MQQTLLAKLTLLQILVSTIKESSVEAQHMHVNSQDSFLVIFQCYLHSHTRSDVIWIFYTRGRRSHNITKYAIINDSNYVV